MFKEIGMELVSLDLPEKNDIEIMFEELAKKYPPSTEMEGVEAECEDCNVPKLLGKIEW
nr:hypothetical protein [Brucella anthropi]